MNRLSHRVFQLPTKYSHLIRQASTNGTNTEAPKSNTKPKTNPTRASPLVDEIIRINHAGELGADRIYAGQYAILGKTSVGPTLAHMWEQEKVHRREFERLIREYRVRPTIMTPIWHVAGFALGAGTALLGEKAAMACTVAVETVIVEHYNDQLRQIMENPSIDKVFRFNFTSKSTLIRTFYLRASFSFVFIGTFGYYNEIP